MVVEVLADAYTRTDPFFERRLEPKAATDNVFDDVVCSKFPASVTAGSLAVAVNVCKAEDVIE